MAQAGRRQTVYHLIVVFSDLRKIFFSGGERLFGLFAVFLTAGLLLVYFFFVVFQGNL